MSFHHYFITEVITKIIQLRGKNSKAFSAPCAATLSPFTPFLLAAQLNVCGRINQAVRSGCRTG